MSQKILPRCSRDGCDRRLAALCAYNSVVRFLPCFSLFRETTSNFSVSCSRICVPPGEPPQKPASKQTRWLSCDTSFPMMHGPTHLTVEGPHSLGHAPRNVMLITRAVRLLPPHELVWAGAAMDTSCDSASSKVLATCTSALPPKPSSALFSSSALVCTSFFFSRHAPLPHSYWFRLPSLPLKWLSPTPTATMLPSPSPTPIKLPPPTLTLVMLPPPTPLASAAVDARVLPSLVSRRGGHIHHPCV